MLKTLFFTIAMAPAAGGASPEAAPNPLVGLAPIFLIFIVFYFLLLRLQQQKQKQHEAMIKNVKKHDEIVTGGGIHGTIVALKEHTVILRVDDKVRIEVERSAISRIIKSKENSNQSEAANG